MHTVIPALSRDPYSAAAIEKDVCQSALTMGHGAWVPAQGRDDKLDVHATDLNHPTSPFIGFTGALSGNTVSASTRSAKPN